MSLKTYYYYLFYQFYRHYQNSSNAWLSDWKAVFSIDILLIFIFLSMLGYYSLLTNEIWYLENPHNIGLLIVTLITSFNYYVFNYDNKWKIYVRKFDKWPRRKNRIGGMLVLVLILLIFINLIYMFFLLSQAKW
jgi:amino acid transporter